MVEVVYLGFLLAIIIDLEKGLSDSLEVDRLLLGQCRGVESEESVVRCMSLSWK